MGAGLLAKDGYALWKRGLRSSESTLEEAIHYTNVRWDLTVGTPLLLYYLVPIVGNTVIIAALAFPSVLPTCWRSPHLRAKLLQRAERRAQKESGNIPSSYHPDFAASLFPLYFAWPSWLAPAWLKRKLVLWRWGIIQYQGMVNFLLGSRARSNLCCCIDSFLKHLDPATVPHDVLEKWASYRGIPIIGDHDVSLVPYNLPKNGLGIALIPGKEREERLRRFLTSWQRAASSLPADLSPESYCVRMHVVPTRLPDHFQ